MSGGDCPGGLVAGNFADELILNLDGELTGDLTTIGNTVRQAGRFIASGVSGGSEHQIAGNDFRGTLSINRLDSLVRFNRLAGDVAVIQGTDVDASLNWWGCNAGPGAAGCSAPLTAGFKTSPWLTFTGTASCDALVAQASFDLLTASDSSVPSGNITPGEVDVNTNEGVVLTSPVTLVGGAGCSLVELQGGTTTPVVTMQLDGESIEVSADCSHGIQQPPCSNLFADGFESGTLAAWD